jgi:hypothetical protein
VGFSGTHGVFKSTVLNALRLKLEEAGFKVSVVEETIRKIPPGLVIGGPENIISEIFAFTRQVSDELYAYYELQNETDGEMSFLLCDRTVFDVLPYIIFSNQSDGIDEEDDIIWLMRGARNYHSYFNPYDKIFWFRPHGDLEIIDDGFRFIDIDARGIIDSCFCGMYEELCSEVDISEIPEGDLSDKVSFILDALCEPMQR